MAEQTPPAATTPDEMAAEILRQFARYAGDWLKPRTPDGFVAPYSAIQVRTALLAGTDALEQLQATRDRLGEAERGVAWAEERLNTTPDLEQAIQAAKDALWHQKGLIWSPAAIDRQARLCVEAVAPVLLQASRDRILDIAVHATPYGDLPEDPGYVGTYLLSAGALHRALGLIGHTAPSCKAEADLQATRDRHAALEIHATLLHDLLTQATELINHQRVIIPADPNNPDIELDQLRRQWANALQTPLPQHGRAILAEHAALQVQAAELWKALDTIRQLYLDLTAKGQHSFYITRSYDVAMNALQTPPPAAGQAILAEVARLRVETAKLRSALFRADPHHEQAVQQALDQAPPDAAPGEVERLRTILAALMERERCENCGEQATTAVNDPPFGVQAACQNCADAFNTLDQAAPGEVER